MTTPEILPNVKSPVVGVVLMVLWVLGFGGAGAWIVYAQVSGEPTTAVVEECEHRSKPASYVCTGTWTLDGVTTTGIVEGTNSDAEGKEIEVRVKGDRAYTLSLRLPIILGVITMFVPAWALYGVVVRRRQRRSAT